MVSAATHPRALRPSSDPADAKLAVLRPPTSSSPTPHRSSRAIFRRLGRPRHRACLPPRVRPQPHGLPRRHEVVHGLQLLPRIFDLVGTVPSKPCPVREPAPLRPSLHHRESAVSKFVAHLPCAVRACCRGCCCLPALVPGPSHRAASSVDSASARGTCCVTRGSSRVCACSLVSVRGRPQPFVMFAPPSAPCP